MISFGLRPNSVSMLRNFFNSVSGLSPVFARNPTTALMNFGDPGGQSSGSVSQREERKMDESERSCSRFIAATMMLRESPRFDPRATKAIRSRFITCNRGRAPQTIWNLEIENSGREPERKPQNRPPAGRPQYPLRANTFRSRKQK